MLCDYQETETPGVYECERCGNRNPRPLRKPRHRTCTGPRGIGDHVAALLEAVGFKKKPGCGCDKRRRFLNGIFGKRKKTI